MKNNIRMNDRQWSAHMWSRIKSLFTGLDNRVTALEQGGGGGGEMNRINSISVNGTNVPPDANKNVALTIPTQTSDLTNDSGYITAADVDTIGFYIDAQGYVCQQITSDTQGG